MIDFHQKSARYLVTTIESDMEGADQSPSSVSSLAMMLISGPFDDETFDKLKTIGVTYRLKKPFTKETLLSTHYTNSAH